MGPEVGERATQEPLFVMKVSEDGQKFAGGVTSENLDVPIVASAAFRKDTSSLGLEHRLRTNAITVPRCSLPER
jgi:hypothetical protein